MRFNGSMTSGASWTVFRFLRQYHVTERDFPSGYIYGAQRYGYVETTLVWYTSVYICPRVHICSTSYDNDPFSLTAHQWRTEGLQRPGVNACIGAPPQELTPPLPHRPTRQAPSGFGVPPPPRLVNPASATALCNEVTLLICLGLIFLLQLGPTSWAGAPSKACARGPCPPCPPPAPPPSARHC